MASRKWKIQIVSIMWKYVTSLILTMPFYLREKQQLWSWKITTWNEGICAFFLVCLYFFYLVGGFLINSARREPIALFILLCELNCFIYTQWDSQLIFTAATPIVPLIVVLLVLLCRIHSNIKSNISNWLKVLKMRWTSKNRWKEHVKRSIFSKLSGTNSKFSISIWIYTYTVIE